MRISPPRTLTKSGPARVDDYLILVQADEDDIVVTLPKAALAAELNIKRIDDGTGGATVTIVPVEESGVEIDGEADLVIVPLESHRLMSGGRQWWRT